LGILEDKFGIDLKEKDLTNLFNEIDLNKNGATDNTEFLASTIDLKKEVKLNHIYEAFELFNNDKSGRISLKEMTDIILPSNEDDIDHLNQLIKSNDLNGDGEIDFEEFLGCLGIYLEPFSGKKIENYEKLKKNENNQDKKIP